MEHQDKCSLLDINVLYHLLNDNIKNKKSPLTPLGRGPGSCWQLWRTRPGQLLEVPAHSEPQPASTNAIKHMVSAQPSTRPKNRCCSKHCPGNILACPGHTQPNNLLRNCSIVAHPQHPAPNNCSKSIALASFWHTPGRPSPTKCRTHDWFSHIPGTWLQANAARA